MTHATTMTPKRSFTLLAKDGATPLAARIPIHLSVGEAVGELAAYAGYPAEPDVSTRYALAAAVPKEAGAFGELVLLRDDETFAEVAEQSLLRIAPQARPASRLPQARPASRLPQALRSRGGRVCEGVYEGVQRI